jgi:hypothetical protein
MTIYTPEQGLTLYYEGFEGMPLDRQAAWNRFFDEAQCVLKQMDTNLLRDWSRRSLSIAVGSTVARFDALRGLIKSVVKGAWNEFKRFFRALVGGNLGEWFKDACKRAWNALGALWQRVKAASIGVKDFVASLPGANREELINYGTSFLGAVLGFILIGGTGDGGVIDLDIKALGIGGHRSIWFHSIFVGLTAEICFLSAFELVKLLHERLPKRHSPIWDRMLCVQKRFAHGLVTGSWVGVATHLAIDSHFDGWTPYKDLPVALPEWGHHLVMDLNAAAAGWLGWHWHDKVKSRFRDNSFAPASALGRRLSELSVTLIKS